MEAVSGAPLFIGIFLAYSVAAIAAYKVFRGLGLI